MIRLRRIDESSGSYTSLNIQISFSVDKELQALLITKFCAKVECGVAVRIDSGEGLSACNRTRDSGSVSDLCGREEHRSKGV